MVGWRVLGSVLYAAYVFQTVGLGATIATRAGFLTGLFVVLVPLLSALVVHRPRASSAWVAALLAMLGLALLSLPIDLSLAPGDGLMLLCALTVAVTSCWWASAPVALTCWPWAPSRSAP